MISRREAELLARRAVLRERIREERHRLATAVQPLALACDRLDRMRVLVGSAVTAVRELATRYPLLVVAGVALLGVARPRRVWRWGGHLFRLWRLARRAQMAWQRFTTATRTLSSG